MVSTWRQAIEARISDSPERKLSREESTELFQRQFSATLQRYNERGIHIHLWEPVPGARKDVPHALARAVLTKRRANIEYGLNEYLDTSAFFFSALQTNRHLIASTFSPSKTLCSSGMCAVTINGIPAYFDNNHITRSSADFWASKMNEKE